MLLRQAEKIRKKFGANKTVGQFAGFSLSVRAEYDESVSLVLKGRNLYTARVTDTAQGTIRSLEAEVQGFEATATRLESQLCDAQKLVQELESKVGVPFEPEQRFHELTQRQAEIEEKLDLTKNQAPAQAEAVAEEGNEEAIKPTVAQKKSPNRKAGVRV